MVQTENLTERKPLIFSIRFLLAILGCFAYTIQFSQNGSMSIAIVDMVNHTAVDLLKEGNNVNIMLNNSYLTNQNTLNVSNIHFKSSDGQFVWNKTAVAMILSAYFFGYALSQVFGAWLSLKFGSKIVLGITVLSFSILTMSIPLAASFSYKAVIVVRFLIGFLQGPIWPSFTGFWTKWVPPSERNTLLAIASSGCHIGSLVAFSLGGYLCEHGFNGGWPSVFYIFGMVGVFWSILWFVFSSNSPRKNRFIKQSEVDYIENETIEFIGTNLETNQKIPWLSIMKDRHVLALFVGHVTSEWVYFLFLTCLPMFMKEVLQFDISSNGLMSALPYIFLWIFEITSAVFADRILKNKFQFQTKTIRIIFNTVGFFGPMFAMIGLMFVTNELKFLGVVLITLGCAFLGCTYSTGYMVSFNDICGPLSGIVYGIANTISSTVSISAPFCVRFLTPNKTQKEWQMVFLICALMSLIGGLATIIFAIEDKTKSWALEKNETNLKKNKI